MSGPDHAGQVADLLERGEQSPFFQTLRRSASLQRELGAAMGMDALLRFQLGAVRPSADLPAQVEARIKTHERGRAAAVPVPAPRLPETWRHRRTPAPAMRNWVLLAASLLILVGGYVFTRQLGQLRLAPPLAIVTAARDAVVSRAGVDRPARPDQALLAEDELRTAPNGGLSLRYAGEASSLALSAGTTLTLGRDAPGKQVRLQRGTLEGVMAAQTPGAPMAFTTPHALVVVRGTRLTLRVDPDATQVDLHEGRVDASNRHTGESVRLHDGESVRIGMKQTAVTRPSASPARVTQGLLALYTFRETGGSVVHDVAGVGRPLNLRVLDPRAVQWMPGGGLRVSEPARIVSEQPADKIVRACQTGNEITLELWIQTWQTSQLGPARILAIGPATSAAPGEECAMLGTYNLRVHNPTIPGPWYCARLRTADSPENEPTEILTEANSVTPALTHLVLARASNGELRFMINGQDRLWAQADFNLTTRALGLRTRKGHFRKWALPAFLSLANEPQGRRPWVGNLYLAAVYGRALSYEEIRRNFQAGPSPGQPVPVREAGH
ncbi:MAG: FecR domain-containing protein [Kiritimatiellae bacterium]|nr:FecR domain-containing protein [Kiritimatiellia bacterium]